MTDVSGVDLVALLGPLLERSELAELVVSELVLVLRGPIGYELRGLDVVAGEDVAYLHGLNHVEGTATGGDELDMWWRSTLGLRKQGGEWQATHSHTSVPFDMETSKALLDLQP